MGQAYEQITPERKKMAMSKEYTEEILMGKDWVLPAGAFAESCGPI